MYDPTIGRWLSPDPTGFTAGDTNDYRYVGNSTTDVTDPTGLASSKSTRGLYDSELKFMYFAVDVLYSLKTPAEQKAIRKVVREELPKVKLIVPSEEGIPEKLDGLLGFIPRAVNNLLEGVPSADIIQFFALQQGAKAVTIRNRIFFQKMPDIHKPDDVNTIFHELFHSVEQSINIPVWFVDYLKDYKKQMSLNGNDKDRAYRAIPAEMRGWAFGQAVADVLKNPKFNALFYKLGNLSFDQIDQLVATDPSYRELADALKNAFNKYFREQENKYFMKGATK